MNVSRRSSTAHSAACARSRGESHSSAVSATALPSLTTHTRTTM
ncbi:hypothetical protein ACFQE4_16260 [Streptomyces thermocoprophilus]